MRTWLVIFLLAACHTTAAPRRERRDTEVKVQASEVGGQQSRIAAMPPLDRACPATSVTHTTWGAVTNNRCNDDEKDKACVLGLQKVINKEAACVRKYNGDSLAAGLRLNRAGQRVELKRQWFQQIPGVIASELKDGDTVRLPDSVEDAEIGVYRQPTPGVDGCSSIGGPLTVAGPTSFYTINDSTVYLVGAVPHFTKRVYQDCDCPAGCGTERRFVAPSGFMLDLIPKGKKWGGTKRVDYQAGLIERRGFRTGPSCFTAP